MKKMMFATLTAGALFAALTGEAFAYPSDMKAPWTGGVTYSCTQGNGGSYSHSDVWNRYAWDFGLPTGTAVKAVSGGTITFKGWDTTGYGNKILIRHSDGSYSQYAHLNSFASYNVGATVARGTTIGYSGATGNVSGPHLHFSIVDGSGYSLSSRFSDIGLPVSGYSYTSGNY